MSNISMSGCDVHDKNLVLCTAIGLGRPQWRTFENTAGGRAALIMKLQHEAQQAGCARVVLAYEASSQGYHLYDELRAAGIECYVLAPTKIKRSEQDKRNKTDRRDSQRLLELVRGHCLAGNELPKVEVPTPQQRDDREVLRCRLDIASELQRVRTKITSLFKRSNVLKPASEKRSAWLKKQACGKDSQLTAGARTVLKSLLRRMAWLRQELKVVDNAVLELAQQQRHQPAVAELTKLKGVGVLSAMVFLVEIGTVTRFKNRRQIGAYVGLVPRANESGESADRKGHITRQGSSAIRRVLCQCAWARIRTDPQEMLVYERLKAKNPKKKKIAVVALMRRLAVRMWHAGVRAAG